MLDSRITIERKKFSAYKATIWSLVLVMVVVFGMYHLMKSLGLRNLRTVAQGLEDTAITLEGKGNDLVVEGGELPEGHILYGGKEYAPNEELISILVMGIDKETVREIGGQSWEEEEGSQFNGGQADALFLVILNPHKKNISIIAINRNTMADVDVWDKEGNYRGIFTQQIALQHGYGDGKEESCLRQVKAVSRLLQGIPIHAYAAISMDAIPELNDAVGGVTVEVLDDIIYPEYDMDLHQGQTVTLMGDKAYWYVRLRNENAFNSNALRLERQKQFLAGFAAMAKEYASGDVRVAVELYKILDKYTTTDLNLNSYTYLASEAMDYEFKDSNIYALLGETIRGNQFEEFYADKEAKQELIIKLFYEPV